MFHCNGWTYTWAVTAAGGTHVCLRRVDPALIFPAIREHQRYASLRRADRAQHAGARAGRGEARVRPRRRRRDRRRGAAVGGDRGDGDDGLPRDASLRPHRVLRPGDAVRVAARLAQRCHRSERARLHGAAGRADADAGAGCTVADPATDVPVPRDGATLGEAHAPRQHGDEGLSQECDGDARRVRATAGSTPAISRCWHPDGYVEIKDRAKDIIISGGENVSSLEVEECLYRHPQVMEAAVVARPDREVGRDAVRVRDTQARRDRSDASRHHRLVPRASRALQGAAHRRVRTAAEDVDRQDPEVRAARASEGRGRAIASQGPKGASPSDRERPTIGQLIRHGQCGGRAHDRPRVAPRA